MRIKPMVIALVLATVAVGFVPGLVSTPVVQAQGVTPDLLAGYLSRTGLTWKRDDKDVRTFALSEGKYLGLGQVSNQPGLMKDMLNRNATAFGSYFVDSEGDIGFRFIFTTESGLGYPAFKAVADELLRIADEVIVGLHQKYR